MQESLRRRSPNDGARKYLVLASSYVTLVIDASLVNSIGSLFLPIMKAFDASRAEAAVIQSTMIAVAFAFGIVSGLVVTKFGPRIAGIVGSTLLTVGIAASYFASSLPYLIVSVGVLPGIGVSLLFVSSTAATEAWFADRAKVIAVAVLATGIGVGSMGYPYLLVYLNDKYGFRVTFLIVGAISTNCIACCLLWNKRVDEGTRETDAFQSKNEIHENVAFQSGENDVCSAGKNIIKTTGQFVKHPQPKPSTDIDTVFPNDIGETNINNARRNSADQVSNTTETVTCTPLGRVKILLTDKSFVAFAIAVSLSSPIIHMPMIFLTDVFTDKSLLEKDAVLGLFIMNLVSIAGRISPGFVIHSRAVPIMSVPLLGSIVGALSLVGLALVPNLALNLGTCGVMGLCMGMLLSMYTVASVALVDRDHLSTAIGIMMTASGVTLIITGPITGFLRDRSNSYTIPFYLAAAILVVACITYVVAHATRKDRSHKETNMPEVHVATIA